VKFKDMAEAEYTYEHLMSLLRETAKALGHTGSVEGVPAAARRTMVDLDNARDDAVLSPRPMIGPSSRTDGHRRDAVGECLADCPVCSNA
jgi:hypothetical protein